MFRLVVLVYMSLIGEPAGVPMEFENKTVFTTGEECKAYPKSGEGAAQYNALMTYLAKSVPDGNVMTIELTCRRTEGEPI